MLLPLLMLHLGFSMSIVAIRAKGACLALVIKTAHHRLVLARVGCCQPSVILCQIRGGFCRLLSHISWGLLGLERLGRWWSE